MHELLLMQQYLYGRTSEVWRDPFDPHEEALFVQTLGTGHKLLLNKYNVVEHHCLVVTKSGRHALISCHGIILQSMVGNEAQSH